MTSLIVDAEAANGDFRLQASLEVPPGITAVVGPNGAGKTTLLTVVAGFLPLTRGSVWLGDDVWEDFAAGVRVPPGKRRCGFVFQDFRLFPALNVVDNVAFGLRAQGTPETPARDAAKKLLWQLELSDLAQRRIGGLSGGERQRVALARALAIDPAVLLLDEALSALDAGVRLRTRSLLREALRERRQPTLVVTHDPVEAFSLGERIVVVEDGVTVWSGGVDDVHNAPASSFLAALRGLNAVTGRLQRRNNDLVVVTDTFDLIVGAPDLPAGTQVFATFPASAVTLAAQQPQVSARNVFSGPVAEVHSDGETAHVRLGTTPPITALVTASSVATLDLRPGTPVWAYVKATEIRVDAAG